MSYTKHDRIVSGAEIYAADIKDMDNKIYDHDSDISDLQDSVDVLEPTASASDVGKALKVKTVAGGKVTAYEFGETAIIDNTLSEAGMAADAKKTGDEITGLKSALNQNKTAPEGYILTATNAGNGTVWSPVGLPTDEQTEQAVADWLNDHPEATTTVEDGSIEKEKFTDGLKLLTIKDYVTPEMFYAKGNGSDDDSVCLQNAINYAITNNKAVKIISTYGIANPVHISGNVYIIGCGKKSGFKCVSNDLSAFFIFDNVSHGYDSTCFANVKFNANGSNAYGIEFNNSFIMYNQMYRIEFNGFTNACIHLINSSSGVIGSYGVYAHDIQWSNILAMNCSTLIGQTGSNAYIYGGTIEHVSMEGNHADDTLPYYIDLTDFRGVTLSDIIIEGSPLAKKQAAIKMNHGLDIRGLYFEFSQAYASNYPENIIIVNNVGYSTKMEIDGWYGNLYAPFLLTDIDLWIRFDGAVSLNTYVGPGGQLDANSSGSKLIFENAYYGGEFSPQKGNRLVKGEVYNQSIKLLAQRRLFINNDVPLIEYDLSKIDDNGSGFYKVCGYFLKDTGYENNLVMTAKEDPVFGNVLTLTTTSQDNFLHCSFRIVHSNLPIIINPNKSFITIVMTLKANVDATDDDNKYYLRNSPSASLATIFGTREKVKNSYTTLVMPVTTYNGGLTNIRIDDPAPGEICDVPRSYTICNIALFKGIVFGACKSKLIVESPSTFRGTYG